MKRFVIIPLILFISFWAAMLNADIYSWTDEKGVRYFTNYDPPKQAKLIIKAAQFTTDEKAVQGQIEAKRLERQQLELEEVAQKQTLISLKQQAIEEQLDAADRRAEEAEEALKRYKEIFDDAPGFNGGYDDFSDGGDDVEVTGTTYGYYPYYFYRGHFNHRLNHHSHFKHRRSHHFRKRPFGHTGKHYFRHFKKHRFGKFHHAKGRHGFNGRGHRFTGNFRGSHHSRTHFRGGHRSRGNFRGGHRGGRR
jgi:hypothetical protein